MRLVVIITLLVVFCIPTFADKPRIVFDTDITGDVDDVLAGADTRQGIIR